MAEAAEWINITEDNFELPKFAELRQEFTPYPHQSRANKKAHAMKGRLLLAHGTGLGKSFTAISVAEDALDSRGAFREAKGKHVALGVVPAGLRVNFVDNVRKFTKRRVEIIDNGEELDFILDRMDRGQAVPPYLVMSWDLLRQDAKKARKLNPRIVMFDEMDAAKDAQSANYNAARIVRAGVSGAVGMAASFVSNTPDDIPVLLSIITDGEIPHDLPLRKMVTSQVDNVPTLFGKPRPVFHVDRPDIVQSLGQFIDFADPDDLEDMPTATTEYVPVEMSKDQHKYYQQQIARMPKSWAKRVMQGQWFGGPKNRAMAARQAAQSTYGKYGDSDKTIDTSTKVQKMVRDLDLHLKEKPRNKVVIYSNFVDSGVRPVHMALAKAGVPHSVFIGQGNELDDETVDETSRNRAVEDFKAGRTRVILVSGAGAKGLDLKSGTMFMAAEGHFNPEVVRQAQARIRRLGAHKDVPKKDRRVAIRRYVSVEPAPGLFTRIKRWAKGEPKHHKTTDEWVYDVARAKHFTNEGVRISLQGRIPLMPGQQPPKSPKTIMRGPFKYETKKRSLTTGKWTYKYPKEL